MAPEPENAPNEEHVWRFAHPRLGKARVVSGHRLRPGVVVEVTEFYRDRMVCWARTSWGAEMRVFTSNLDFGREFRTSRGEWIPESDPRARRWMLKVREELLAGGEPRHIGDYGRALHLEEVERILRRNGWSEKREVKLGPPWG